jgi:hypothetical protein
MLSKLVDNSNVLDYLALCRYYLVTGEEVVSCWLSELSGQSVGCGIILWTHRLLSLQHVTLNQVFFTHSQQGALLAQ